MPNHLHVEWPRRAPQAGKHVLCAKPLTMQAREFEELTALRNQFGLIVADAFMIAHHPQLQWVRSLLQDGVIGRCVQTACSPTITETTQGLSATGLKLVVARSAMWDVIHWGPLSRRFCRILAAKDSHHESMQLDG
ncbi:Gfo/Idh/MocA family oxidoreductase [Ruegeria hyattellae]|uniref:Gfo/Idh/MocA family oxidoreductase n=1 Tax=Ruegeria hyattellae TaxID=3233337 RepID=UPI00355B3429